MLPGHSAEPTGIGQADGRAVRLLRRRRRLFGPRNPAEHLPRKRVPVPEQMDSTLLYLVAPASECVTGATIRIDDGQSARTRM